MTEVDICNMALQKLGNADNYIDKLSDATKEARALNRSYAPIRDLVLADFPWNFAEVWAVLTADVGSPAYGYTYQYAMPSDCLQMRIVSDNELLTEPFPQWKRVGSWIYCDVPTNIWVVYTGRMTVATLFDNRFCHALAARLALETAESLIGASANKKAELYQEYQALTKQAHRIDAV